MQQIPSVDRDEINRQERISSNGNYWVRGNSISRGDACRRKPELPIRGFRVGQAKPNRHHSLVRLNWYACTILLVRLSKCAHRNPETYHHDSWHLGRARQRSLLWRVAGMVMPPNGTLVRVAGSSPRPHLLL